MKKYFVILVVLLLPSVFVAAQDYKYHVISISYGDLWNVVRYQKETGKAWYVENGSFVEVRDEAPLPLSDYTFSTSSTQEWVLDFPPIMSYWQLVRIDTLSGQTWWADGDQWVLIEN